MSLLHPIRLILRSTSPKAISFFALNKYPTRFVPIACNQHYSSDHPISRFPIVDEDNMSNLPDDVQKCMVEVKEKSGFLPNIFKTLANRPDEFRVFFDYYDAIMEKDGLTKAEKEMIVVATSAINNCNYCLTAHGALLRIYSKNPLLGEQVAFHYSNADITVRQKVMLDFAVEIAKGKPISDDQVKHLKISGFSDDDIWDIGAISSFFAMANRMVQLTNIRPNDEFYMLGRIPRKKN